MGVLLLTATLPEQATIASRLGTSVSQQVMGMRVLNGSIGGREVTIAEAGMGAVNTAHTLTRSLQVARPSFVLQVGVGGAYANAGLGIGDLAVADEECYGDVGVRTQNGWKGAEFIGIPIVQKAEDVYYNRFPTDVELTRRAREILASASWNTAKAPVVKSGPFVTVQECSGTTVMADERSKLFGAVCENMEGAAAAHICLLYDVPFVEVRGISNLAEDRRRESWDLQGAAEVTQEAALHLIEDLE